MLELADRGGLGRSGRWTRGDLTIRTPAVLAVHRDGRPAPAYAEALLVAETASDARLQIRIGGSAFARLGSSGTDWLPPSKGLPRSVSDLESPIPPIEGDLGLVTSDADVEACRPASAVFLANGVEFLRSPRDFAAIVARVREVLGPAKVVGVTGIAAPSNLAVLVYAGIDLVDSSRMVLDSARAIVHTADGTMPRVEFDPAACACPACEAGQDLQAHNDRALHRELLTVRAQLARGRLRELVERRLANDPWNTAVLRHLDLRHADLLEAHTPVEGGELLAYSHESLTRPEVVRFRRRLRTRYAKPGSARVLLLLPCSARKPYSSSRSHRRFRDAILAAPNPSVVHEVIVTSPLGLIPRELERMYPARSYDIPVTGDWSRDEASVVLEDLRAFVVANAYDAVVAHLGAEASAVREALPDAAFPSDGRPTSDASLAALTRALRDASAGFDRVPGGRRFSEEMANIARFQLGDAGRALVEGATFRGRFPSVRILRGGTQLAAHTERGMLSLTLEGGALLSAADAYCVEIEDFRPEGNVFAVGVAKASPEIRIGDEVVVRHGSEVRAVGVARMSGREMTDLRRGQAVHVRHALPSPAKP
jgi:archaeosine synthase